SAAGSWPFPQCSSWPAGSRRAPWSASEQLAEEALLLQGGEAQRTVLPKQAGDGVLVGLAGLGRGFQDHRLALVGGVEHVGRLGDHADRLQAEYFLDVGDA